MLILAPPPVKALAIFVLKEAVYKALSPLVREPIGFQEAEISTSEESIGVELAPALVSKVPSEHILERQAQKIQPHLYVASGLLIGTVILPT
jgi:4'-phosphopantetheinyl transferase EntD